MIVDQLIQLVPVGVAALLCAVVWRAADRAYHWRRTLDTLERAEWDRVLASLRSPGVE